MAAGVIYEVFSSAEETDEYFLNLGRFVHAYAGLEVTLRLLTMQYLGLDMKTSNIVLSGDRTERLIAKIKDLRKARDSPEDKDLTLTFDQVKILQEARNVILHYQAGHADGMVKASNRYFIKNPMEHTIKEIILTPKILSDLYNDVTVAVVKLQLHMLRVFSPDGFSLDPALDILRRISETPWRYTKGR